MGMRSGNQEEGGRMRGARGTVILNLAAPGPHADLAGNKVNRMLVEKDHLFKTLFERS